MNIITFNMQLIGLYFPRKDNRKRTLTQRNSFNWVAKMSDLGM